MTETLLETEAVLRGASRPALTFALQGEIFAIDADTVREILDMPAITRVPNAPAFANGLINVRGRVVPLADLRVTFAMDRPEPDADTRIIVIETLLDGEENILGIVADKVLDVCDLEDVAIEDAPQVGMRWHPEFLLGIGRYAGDFVILPNIGQIFADHLNSLNRETN
ncbi:chemotaxis protein CheW [Stakelama pacifica]|uniref:CheW protein n=1 Tax=Stakelama pacifica TaxID=517720 RepID=A0A4R6FZ78_9SPHN|nr:chemotaxis protein CheW [Stakelama pacifica]TDN86464.1 CheW protein [Stakelama pacifica]GGO89720.1 chemotaxis protein CheW [Stakelama pacifica]